MKVDVGQAANTIASIGVIVGIAFLAVELNQTQDLARAQMRNEIALSWQEMSRDDIEGRIADILVLDQRGEPLSESDQIRLDIYNNMWLRSLDNIYYQYRQGLYSQPAFEANMYILQNDPKLAAHLCEYPHSFDPEFLAYVDSLLNDYCE